MAFGYRIASPNEAIVITGRKSQEKQFRILTGKGAFVFPFFSRFGRLNLDLRESQLNEPCVTSQGINLGVQAVCVFKVGDDEQSISNAARRFLDQQQNMEPLVGKVLAGHLRSIVGGLTVEQIIKDRNALATEVLKSSSDEMERMGLEINSFQIREIQDPSNYIEQLRAPHIAAVTRDARIAEAAADQAATQKEQEANVAKAGFQRDAEIATAEANGRAAAAQEEANQQGPLAQAQAQQAVAEQNAELARKNATVKDAQLDAEVRKPADAAKYQAVTEAEAAATVAVTQANADAEAANARAKSADAVRYQNVTTAEGDRDAMKARAEGAQAQAQSIETVGQAEAIVIKAKNDALGDGNLERQVATRMVELMPEIVKGISSSLQGANLTILNGADGLTDVVTGVLGQGKLIFDTVRGMSTAVAAGIDTTAHSIADSADAPASATNGAKAEVERTLEHASGKGK